MPTGFGLGFPKVCVFLGIGTSNNNNENYFAFGCVRNMRILNSCTTQILVWTEDCRADQTLWMRLNLKRHCNVRSGFFDSLARGWHGVFGLRGFRVEGTEPLHQHAPNPKGPRIPTAPERPPHFPVHPLRQLESAAPETAIKLQGAKAVKPNYRIGRIGPRV